MSGSFFGGNVARMQAFWGIARTEGDTLRLTGPRSFGCLGARQNALHFDPFPLRRGSSYTVASARALVSTHDSQASAYVTCRVPGTNGGSARAAWIVQPIAACPGARGGCCFAQQGNFNSAGTLLKSTATRLTRSGGFSPARPLFLSLREEEGGGGGGGGRGGSLSPSSGVGRLTQRCAQPGFINLHYGLNLLFSQLRTPRAHTLHVLRNAW